MNKGFYIGVIAPLFVFVAINLIAAHFQSDCGISDVIGLVVPDFSGCYDTIVRIGFPFQFLEEGGFAYRSIFNPLALISDFFLAQGLTLIAGLIARRWGK